MELPFTEMGKSVGKADLRVVVVDGRKWELVFTQVKVDMPITNMYRSFR